MKSLIFVKVFDDRTLSELKKIPTSVTSKNKKKNNTKSVINWRIKKKSLNHKYHKYIFLP